MECAERIRALREDNVFTQSVVSYLLHVAQNTYSCYEKGKIEIPTKYLNELAKFYDVDMNYICGITSTKCKFPK